MFDVQRLIDAAPQIKDIADVKGEQLVNVGSQDMTNEIWLKLARRVDALLKQPDVDAVVITHGTDTMEETAYFLSLVIPSDKPIVMVGSMRPATSLPGLTGIEPRFPRPERSGGAQRPNPLRARG